ncbi:MAG: lysoplasmalogenase family protein [Oscillospiraceae bacterium]|nr:lysoplasmalogenase family protein [Oscillospiraceae bacterium]
MILSTHKATTAFLLAASCLYAIYLVMDFVLPGAYSIPVKYASILLCAAYSFCALGTRGGRLTCAALVGTVLADTFLLLLNRDYPLGLAIFCVVHLIYLRRLRLRGGWPVPLCLLLRVGIPCGATILCLRSGLASPTVLLACWYFPQLALNAAESLTLRHSHLFSAGLFLFVACDLFIGAAFLATGQVAQLLINIGWIFYLPAQVLLVLSAHPGPLTLMKAGEYP